MIKHHEIRVKIVKLLKEKIIHWNILKVFELTLITIIW